jgi:hypothetical protein
MIVIPQVFDVLKSPGANEPESVVSLCIPIPMGPAEECLPKKAARGQNDGWRQNNLQESSTRKRAPTSSSVRSLI